MTEKWIEHVSMENKNWDDIQAAKVWCIKQFGDQADWTTPNRWDNGVWFFGGGSTFWFDRESDAVLFTLRWK